MSFRAAIRLALVCVLFALIPSVTQALSVHAFPLWVQEREGDTSRLHILWPIFERERAPGRSVFALRPLWHSERDENEGVRRWNALWPLMIWRHDRIGTERERSVFWLLPVVHWKRQADPLLAPWRLTVFPILYMGRTGPEPDQRYTIVFPLWWQASNTRVFFPIFWSSGERFTALFPLWGYFRDLWGRDDIRFVLWPVWSRAQRGEAIAHNVLWPFFAWQRTEGRLTGVRAWPIYGHREREGIRRGFYLWPLGHFRSGTGEDGRPHKLFFFLPFRLWWEIGRTELDVHWPFVGTYTTPGRETWSFAWPLFMRIRNDRGNYTDNRILWFIGRWQRGEAHRALELFPLAGVRESPERRLRYFLFPIFSRWQRFTDTRRSDLRVAMPLFLRREIQNLEESTWRRTTWTFPLFLRRQNSEGWRETHWLFPFFVTSDSAYERSWGGIFRLFGGGAREDGSSWVRLFGPLYNRETSPAGVVVSDYNGLLLRRERVGEGRRWSLLGGLVSVRSGVDDRGLRVFDLGGELSPP